MSLNSEKDRGCKRRKPEVSKTDAEESSFSKVVVPLTLPKDRILQTSLISNNHSPDAVHWSSQPCILDTTCAAAVSATEVNPNLPDIEVNQEAFQQYYTSTSDNNAELELDFMWNEVYETMISETEESDLRDWETVAIAEEDESDFLEATAFVESTPPCSTTGEADSKGKADHCDSQPLYPGASVTIGAVMVLICLYAIKYDLTGDAVTQLLQLMALMLPSGNILPDTLQKFKAFFSKLDTPFVLHHHCGFCLSNVDKDAKTCPNLACLKELSLKQSKAYLIEISIVDQLRTLFSRPGFYTNIQHQFKRKKKNANNMEDI